MIPKLRNCQNLQRKRGIFVIVSGICRGVDKMQFSKWHYWPKKPHKCCTKINPLYSKHKYLKAEASCNVVCCLLSVPLDTASLGTDHVESVTVAVRHIDLENKLVGAHVCEDDWSDIWHPTFHRLNPENKI